MPYCYLDTHGTTDAQSLYDYFFSHSFTGLKDLRRVFLILIATLTAIGIALIWYYPSRLSYGQYTGTYSRPKKKTIIFWNTYYGKPKEPIGRRLFEINNCHFQNCLMTNNKSVIAEASAVMFHGWGADAWETLPQVRHPHQYYVLYLMESPDRNAKMVTKLSGIFNLTMTYRLDSDIAIPYGGYQLRRKVMPHMQFVATAVTKIKRKDRLVAWFVSHCPTGGVRERYVKMLQKYIPVDIYGRCGNLKCPTNASKACYAMLDKRYKFYLSFENSICTDYATEKVFNVLRNTYTVPVVYGGRNYSHLTPPNSIINVKDFKSPKALAEHLLRLSNDTESLIQHLIWKERFVVSTYSFRGKGYCRLCEILNDESFPGRVYMQKDLDNFWGPATCDMGGRRMMKSWNRAEGAT